MQPSPSMCVKYRLVFSLSAAYCSCLSPPAGSCPVSRSCCSSRSRRSPRSINVCPWRTKSCCGSCKTATCSRVPVASPPPPHSTRHGTRPPSRPLRHCRPDNLYLASSTFWPRPDKDRSCSKDLTLLDFVHCKSFGVDALEPSGSPSCLHI